MSRSIHERARELIALSGVEESPDQERTWLEAHLEECARCREYAETAGLVIGKLRSQPLAADFELVEATRRRMRLRADELREQRARNQLVCFACLLVGISAAMTTPLFWRVFEWMGARAGVSSLVWQSGFTFFWMAPALVVSALLLARGTHLGNQLGNRGEKQWS